MEFSTPIPVLDKGKNDVFKNQLHMFFKSYANLCTKVNGNLAFRTGALSEKEKEIFGNDYPPVIKKITEIMGSFSMFAGSGNLVIYKVNRSSGISFREEENVMSRVLLVIGDDAFLQSAVNHGQNTGRGLNITRLLNGGNVFCMKPGQEAKITGQERAEVFVKGKGKQQMMKPKNFEQYVIYYELKFSDQMLKNFKKEMMKTGGVESMINQNKGELNKILGETGLGDIDEVMKNFQDKEQKVEPEIEITEEDQEFLV